MKIHYDDSHAGHGKTTRAIQNLVFTPTRAIFCLEQNEKMHEVEAMIKAKAALAGTNPWVQKINSQEQDSVRKSVSEISQNFCFTNHIIILITHTAMLESDMSAFAGWEIVVDEVPSMLTAKEIQTSMSFKILREYFTLTPHPDPDPDYEGWSIIGLSPEGRKLSAAEVDADDLMNLGPLYRAVVRSETSSSSILARLANWDEASRKKKWFYAHWFSFFDLESFDKITLLGNGFLESVAVQFVRLQDAELAAERGQTIEWIPLPKPEQIAAPIRRIVTIHYFQTEHATRYKMSKPAGQANIVKAAKHLATTLPKSAIWSANNGETKKKKCFMNLMKPHIGIDPISPKQAGSNIYRHVHAAAIMYIANPSPNTAAFLDMAGIDPKCWTATNEHEAILQFATRTSIRDPNSTHPVDCYVLDKDDAQYLADYFSKAGHDVRMNLVNAGLEILTDRRKNNGAKKLDLTEAERKARDNAAAAARMSKKRALEKAAKLAA